MEDECVTQTKEGSALGGRFAALIKGWGVTRDPSSNGAAADKLNSASRNQQIFHFSE